jgi:hypothetical protein
MSFFKQILTKVTLGRKNGETKFCFNLNGYYLARELNQGPRGNWTLNQNRKFVKTLPVVELEHSQPPRAHL